MTSRPPGEQSKFYAETPTVFNHPQFGELRTVEIDGVVWFVGKDVAEALGYSNTKDAIATHVASEDKKLIQRSEITTLEIPNRGMTIINESGLYSLILSSKLPSAKEFKHWVTSEVLLERQGLRKRLTDRISNDNINSFDIKIF